MLEKKIELQTMFIGSSPSCMVGRDLKQGQWRRQRRRLAKGVVFRNSLNLVSTPIGSKTCSS